VGFFSTGSRFASQTDQRIASERDGFSATGKVTIKEKLL